MCDITNNKYYKICGSSKFTHYDDGDDFCDVECNDCGNWILESDDLISDLLIGIKNE